ncbi:hypothetical protein EKO04_011153 [Ascochyta lentis]|uniref:Uncharacterized protein n=1 Tax=Ascochyta lentis TaxID=205686 RepID=A0A8H7IUF8_9PLEO|nr:hypothetical protein EKO04_011153 [Ascochyta lentis]
MRTAGLFTPAALLSLHVLSAHAEPICNTNRPFSSAEFSIAHISSLQVTLGGDLTEFCGESFNAKNKNTFVHKVEGVTFQITGGVTQSIEECAASFAAIIAQCLVDQSADGGKVQLGDGVTYEVYHDNSEDHPDVLDATTIEERGPQDDQNDMDDLLHLMGSGGLESRAGKKKPAAPAKPPANKPGSKPLPIGKPKPTPTPAKPTPSKPTPTPSKPSSSSAAKAAPTKTASRSMI